MRLASLDVRQMELGQALSSVIDAARRAIEIARIAY
jgi:hypothetical protein